VGQERLDPVLPDLPRVPPAAGRLEEADEPLDPVEIGPLRSLDWIPLVKHLARTAPIRP
jgi:hypothetical protein